MKAYWGSGGIARRILDLSIRWRWVVSFTAQPLYPQRKNTWYPLDRRLGRPQSRSGRGGEEKNSKPPPGLEPRIIQPISQRYTDCLNGQRHEYFNICATLKQIQINMSPTISTRVYPKVSGLAAWSKNSKWYSSLPLGAVVSLLCESV
jgi:hypothetical protein